MQTIRSRHCVQCAYPFHQKQLFGLASLHVVDCTMNVIVQRLHLLRSYLMYSKQDKRTVLKCLTTSNMCWGGSPSSPISQHWWCIHVSAINLIINNLKHPTTACIDHHFLWQILTSNNDLQNCREYWMGKKDLDWESQDICHSNSPFSFWWTHVWTAQVTWLHWEQA